MNCVLAFDTATEMLSAAVNHNGRRAQHAEHAPRLHAQKILPLLEDLLQQVGATRADLNALVFGRGPGAFTGIRTAVSVTQGIAFALDIPVFGVSSLMAMAEGARRETGATQIITALDARMGEVYFAAFRFDGRVWVCVAAECVCKPDAVQLPEPGEGEWLAVGTGFHAHGEALRRALAEVCFKEESGAARLPLAEDMLQLALPALRRGEGLPAERAEPVYLRDNVAEKSAAQVSGTTTSGTKTNC